jgi:hypothetical protein
MVAAQHPFSIGQPSAVGTARVALPTTRARLILRQDGNMTTG